MEEVEVLVREPVAEGLLTGQGVGPVVAAPQRQSGCLVRVHPRELPEVAPQVEVLVAPQIPGAVSLQSLVHDPLAGSRERVGPGRGL